MTTALLAPQVMWAQQKNLSGTVVDSQGEPVIGATVKVPGSSTGAITDLDGHFTITVNPGTQLEVWRLTIPTATDRLSTAPTPTARSRAPQLTSAHPNTTPRTTTLTFAAGTARKTVTIN